MHKYSHRHFRQSEILCMSIKLPALTPPLDEASSLFGPVVTLRLPLARVHPKSTDGAETNGRKWQKEPSKLHSSENGCKIRGDFYVISLIKLAIYIQSLTFILQINSSKEYRIRSKPEIYEALINIFPDKNGKFLI